MSDEFVVNGLPLPPLLISLIQEEKWVYPGKVMMDTLIPYMVGPIGFDSVEQMRMNTTRHLEMMVLCAPLYGENFQLAYGSKTSESIELPWLDIEKTVFIGGNEVIGDDMILALDYRTNPIDPRIVMTEWLSGRMWAELTPTFTEFVERLGL